MGNTRVKASVFDASDREVYWYMDTNLPIEKVSSIIQSYDVKKTIISSTRHLDDAYIHQLKSMSHLIIMDHTLNIPITIVYQTPHTLGRDRIAVAVAAAKLFPNEVSVVIDAGTCITMEVVDKEGRYQGGNISPGMYMRMKAMHDYTDKLPEVDLSLPSHFVGKNTTQALQNGIVRGTIYEVRSFIEATIQEYGPCKVLLTGGDGSFFEEHLNFPIFAASNLVHIGLNEIIKLND